MRKNGHHMTPVHQALVVALTDSGFTVSEIAKQAKVSRATVHRYRRKQRLQGLSNPHTADIVKREVARRLYANASHCIDLIEDNHLPRISSYRDLRDASVSTGILVDKARLVSGESTDNHAHVHIAALVSELHGDLKKAFEGRGSSPVIVAQPIDSDSSVTHHESKSKENSDSVTHDTNKIKGNSEKGKSK